MRLRPITLDDGPLYERMRCDPVMTAELGGPLPREGVPGKVKSDVASVEAGRAWIFALVGANDESMGQVCIWDHDEDGEMISEVGWTVLPEFQRRGIGREAARTILTRARDEGRWNIVFAHAGITNVPSNAICRSLGFELLGHKEIVFVGRRLNCNRWRIDLREPGALVRGP